ncbi:MAG: TetR family transcriptional regulator [Acidimicrobiales bacterium]
MPADGDGRVGAPPTRSSRSARAAEIVDAAWQLLEAEGAEALTMRCLAERLGMQAPSLYKHLPDKAALEAALVEEALARMGTVLHHAVARPGRRSPISAVLAAYRRYGVANPHLYRLATAGSLARADLPAGLEAWAGTPFFLATGDPYRAQALWSFAHGMVILEIDARFLDGSDLDRTWRAGATAFAHSG